MTPTSTVVGEPNLLAFVFRADVSLDVFAEVMRVEDGAKVDLTMNLRADLSSTENSVYTAEHTPSEEGWYMVQYRALSAGTNSLVLTSTSRFKAVTPNETTTVTSDTTVTRQVGQGGAMVTSFNATIMSTPGVLAFRTRSD